MPIEQKVVTVASCDLCKGEINTGKTGVGYVNAGVYGAAFHVDCVTPQMLLIVKVLELDDITLVNNRGDFEKLIYSRLLKNQ